MYFRPLNLQRLLYALLCTCLCLSATAQGFVTTWKTDHPGTSGNNQITIPTTGGGYNYTVSWGDGNIDSNVTGNIIHTYAVTDTYTVEITGTFPRIYFNNSDDKEKLLSIDHWGDNPWTSMEAAFYGCKNMELLATDTVNLSGVGTLKFMFAGCEKLNQDIHFWNTSPIKDLTSTFEGAILFNRPLNAWDVSNVLKFRATFKEALSFDQPLNQWITGSGDEFASMFDSAVVFHQNINTWNVSRAEDLTDMFRDAVSFNHPLSDWDVSSVEEFPGMFAGAVLYNQPMDLWDVSNGRNMASMFDGATAFDQNIGGWNVGNVLDMNRMLANCPQFDQDIGFWNTASVKDMEGFLDGSSSFDQYLRDWNVGNVTTMATMFRNATSFDQDIGIWAVDSVIDMTDMFAGDSLSLDNYDSLLIGWERRNLQLGVTFSGGRSLYCAGRFARANMIGNLGWVITDGGPYVDTTVTQAGFTLYTRKTSQLKQQMDKVKKFRR